MNAITLTDAGDEVQCQIVARVVGGRALYCAHEPGEAPPPLDARAGADPDTGDEGTPRWCEEMAEALDAWQCENL